ncbi:MAG TPA: hypothetical protein PK358_13245 [Spirochaetota bacterium]|nr:hypothetical protein [Spirochaetota bacterium]HPJ35796.1 hypothetical protein [Spirochaetota bacterium]
MKLTRKIIFILIFLLSVLTALSAKNYPVPAEFPNKIYSLNAGTHMSMTARWQMLRVE